MCQIKAQVCFSIFQPINSVRYNNVRYKSVHYIEVFLWELDRDSADSLKSVRYYQVFVI